MRLILIILVFILMFSEYKMYIPDAPKVFPPRPTQNIMKPPRPIRPNGRGDQVTALDSLTPEQRKGLTEGAARILSMIPVVENSNLTGAGMYRPQGWDNRSPGYIVLRSDAGQETIMHESLHGFDAMNRRIPSSSIGNPNKRFTFQRYWGQLPPPPPIQKHYETAWERDYHEGIGNKESYATIGQKGTIGIPQNLLRFYNSFFKVDPSSIVYTGR